jgi:hypothetical protein
VEKKGLEKKSSNTKTSIWLPLGLYTVLVIRIGASTVAQCLKDLTKKTLVFQDFILFSRRVI